MAKISLDSMFELFEQARKLPIYPRKLTGKRKSTNRKITINGVDVFLTFGTYDNGELGELFIDLNKEGSTMRALFNCLAIAVSLGIQHGVPIKTFVSFFSYMNFEPSGPVEGYPKIKYGSSIVDVIFRLVGIEYLKMEEYADGSSGVGSTINRPL